MDILVFQFNDVLYSSTAVVNIDCTDLQWSGIQASGESFTHHFAPSNLSDTDVEMSKHVSSH